LPPSSRLVTRRDTGNDVAIAILGELGMTALSQALEARGEAWGKTQGKLEGKREALRAFLETRFGALPVSLRQRIDTVDTDQLDALLRRAATIESLDTL